MRKERRRVHDISTSLLYMEDKMLTFFKMRTVIRSKTEFDFEDDTYCLSIVDKFYQWACNNRCKISAPDTKIQIRISCQLELRDPDTIE